MNWFNKPAETVFSETSEKQKNQYEFGEPVFNFFFKVEQ